VPEGTLYCGAELADKDFQFNRLLQGLTNVLLKLLAKYIGPNVSHSYGGKDVSGRHVLPHIAFPLKTAMYNVIVTPVGATPPTMGELFNETTESRAVRKASTDMNDWNVEDTYSMSFSGSCIDLPTWRVLDPFEMSLSTFWGKSPLRLVIYEQGEAGNVQTVQDANNYLLALQMKFLGLQPGLSKDTADGTQKDDKVQRSPLGMATFG